MSRIDVLIGTQLPLYREVLASTFRAMRPDLVVRAVPQEDLDATVRQLRPLLVICSSVSSTITDLSPAWITLYPEERDEALISVAGNHRTIPGASVLDLLKVMDEAKASLYPKNADDRDGTAMNHSNG